ARPARASAGHGRAARAPPCDRRLPGPRRAPARLARPEPRAARGQPPGLRLCRTAGAAAGVAGAAAGDGPARRAARPGPDLPPLPRSPGMTAILVRKLLRDVRLALVAVALLLAAFE